MHPETIQQDPPLYTAETWKARISSSRIVRVTSSIDVERALPLVLTLSLVSAVATMATSAVMLSFHIPVHTVLCRADTACYPNFFLTTWLLAFASAAFATAYHLSLCLQHRSLRLRKGMALTGSFLTQSFFMATLIFGFLPVRVPLSQATNTPLVPAHGMLRSTIENFRIAQAGGSSVFVHPIDSSALIWTIGSVNDTEAGGRKVRVSVYRRPGDANRFFYTTVARPNPDLVLPRRATARRLYIRDTSLESICQGPNESCYNTPKLPEAAWHMPLDIPKKGNHTSSSARRAARGAPKDLSSEPIFGMPTKPWAKKLGMPAPPPGRIVNKAESEEAPPETSVKSVIKSCFGKATKACSKMLSKVLPGSSSRPPVASSCLALAVDTPCSDFGDQPKLLSHRKRSMNVYGVDGFYDREVRFGMTVAVLVPVSCFFSAIMFLLLTAYPFI